MVLNISTGIDFSVIIRVRNKEQFVGHTIQSVLDFLPGAEIIVIDNNSKDESINICKMFFLKLDEGIFIELSNLIWPFLILENMSPIGSVNVIILLYQLDLVIPGILPEDAISLRAILDILNFL